MGLRIRWPPIMKAFILMPDFAMSDFSGSNFEKRVRELTREELPLPGQGQTAQRLQRLFAVGREDLSLAKLAEAHWDAVAVLSEAGRDAEPGVLYGVWASEIPGNALQIVEKNSELTLHGKKMFCSGASIVDRVLMTVRLSESNSNQSILVDLDLRNHPPENLQISSEPWCILAFEETKTSTLTFNQVVLSPENVIKEPDWYLSRVGFWQGALNPAACWAGGAAALVDFALKSKRNDAHTLAHLAAMEASAWAMHALLKTAGQEIDENSSDREQAQLLALKCRHLIEQLCTDTIRRFARAYGPYPLACDASISRRYQELDLFLRQSHAERDLENLGHHLKNNVLH